MEDTEAACEACIWRLDHHGLIHTGRCDPRSWAGSVQKDLLAHSIMPDLASDAGPFTAYPRCAAVLLIKDEADIIGHNLRWLHHIGVRRFVVMDNLSTDGTLAEIRLFQAGHAEADILLLEDPTVAYLQAQKTSAMAQFAKTRWPDIDWILPVDADEFCIARHGLRALDYVPPEVQALTVPKAIHFLPPDAFCEPAAAPMSRMVVRSGLFIVPPKVILRAQLGLQIGPGNHKVIQAGGGKPVYTGGFQWGFFHREFQTRSFAHFQRKVRNGGAAILAARDGGHDVGGEHWVAWHRVLMQEGETGLRQVFEKECVRALGAELTRDRFDGV
jgi:hypothetical protein